MTPTSYTLPPATHTGPVHLAVADLTRAEHFYRGVLGLDPQQAAGSHLVLGAGGVPLLVLSEQPGARRKPRRSTGLYHFALLYPSRRELAGALRRLVAAEYPLQGASDHLVSEALYLSDPDGNGIELYRDRPRAEWPFRNGRLGMDTLPLDVAGLFAEADDEPGGAPAGTVMGHVHLHVSHLAEAERFYQAALGLDLMVRYGDSAAFLSAGGYHHHLGLNTWAGVGAPPPPDDAVGLRAFTLLVPGAQDVAALREHLAARHTPFEERAGTLDLRDPSGNRLRVLPEAEVPQWVAQLAGT